MSTNERFSKVRNGMQVDGLLVTPDTTQVLASKVDADKYVEECSGTTVPTDGEAGFAVGCKFVDTNGAAGSNVYVNQGTVTDCDFNAVVSKSLQTCAATATGATTGTILDGVTHVTVTSDDANKIVVLPAPVVGTSIVLHNGATGYELRSSAPASIAINGGSGADAESAIPANSTVFMTCVTTTAWKGYFMDADGDVAKVEAAAA